MKVAILQSNYLPWRGYFDLIHDVDHFIFYDEVKYTKNDWRNRNRIATKNGTQWLTVPISKEAVHQKISEVRVTGSWQEEHFKKLYLCYKRAPHFGQLEAFLLDFYRERKWETLSSFNQYSIQSIAKALSITTKFSDSAAFNLSGDRVTRLVNLLEQVNATHYISGPSAADYLKGSESLFQEKGIVLEYKHYPAYKKYQQNVFPFEPYVSIVDLIAHVPFAVVEEHLWKLESGGKL